MAENGVQMTRNKVTETKNGNIPTKQTCMQLRQKFPHQKLK